MPAEERVRFVLLSEMPPCYNFAMESVIRNVRDIEPDKRDWLENAIGKRLEDSQKIVIRVLTPGVEPDKAVRDEAITDLRELSEKGSAHRESLGVCVEEADEALEEAMETVRSREQD